MRNVMIVLVIALVLLGGLYGWMRLGTSRALDAQKVDFEKQLDKAHDALRQAREELNKEKTRSVLLGAVNGLYHTASDLESRNFGTAEKHLRAAVETLKNVEPASVADKEAISTIRDGVEGFKMDVTADVGQQRTAILDLAVRLEQLVK